MRSKRRRNPMPKALLLGLGLPALALYGLFSLIPYERMTAKWPLRISPEEVYAYQRWFDQRPDTMAQVQVERFALDEDGDCREQEGGEGRARGFTAADRTDTVIVSHPDGNVRSWLIRFPEGRPFEDQTEILLEPADLTSIRDLYADEVAREQGLPVAQARLVRLSSCGEDRGLFIAREVITTKYVVEHGSPGSVVLDSAHVARSDNAIAAEARGAVDRVLSGRDTTIVKGWAAAVVGVLRQAIGEERSGAFSAWFEPMTGRVIPVRGPLEPTRTAPGGDRYAQVLDRHLTTAPAHHAMRSVAAELRADSAAWNERLAAIDAANAAAFVGETRIGYVRAQLAHERERFLARLFHPDVEGAYPIMEAGPVAISAEKPALDPLLQRHLSGDTVRFVRGKYEIDHLITVPAGIGVVLEKGTRLNMAPGAGLVVNGALHMRGTVLNPVFIRPTDDQRPWAGIQVNGSGGTPCRINGLRMSGGGATMSPSSGTSAMLILRDCSSLITNSTITDAGEGAAIAVNRGKVKVEKCYIANGDRALVDLIFADADLDGCTLQGGSVGVKCKAGLLHMTDCRTAGSGEAGAQVSLKSEVHLERTTFTELPTGLSLSDGTEARLERCTFIRNGTAVELQRKDPAQGGVRVKAFGCTFEGNGTDRRVDPASSWEEAPATAEPGVQSTRRGR